LEAVRAGTWRQSRATPNSKGFPYRDRASATARCGPGSFEESYPELAPLLATPCDFVIYYKSLRTLPAHEGWDMR
jgi:hypothetical protein